MSYLIGERDMSWCLGIPKKNSSRSRRARIIFKSAVKPQSVRISSTYVHLSIEEHEEALLG